MTAIVLAAHPHPEGHSREAQTRAGTRAATPDQALRAAARYGQKAPLRSLRVSAVAPVAVVPAHRAELGEDAAQRLDSSTITGIGAENR
jgi:hypothetical protein